MSDTGDKVLDHLPVFADVTPCQFDSDLRHHVFRNEKPSDQKSEGFLFADQRRFVAKMWPTVLAILALGVRSAAPH